MRQNALRGPAIDLQAVGLFIQADLLSRVRPDLSVDLIHRISQLHKPRLDPFHGPRSRLRERLPGGHEIPAAANPVAQIANEKCVEIGRVIEPDHSEILTREEGTAFSLPRDAKVWELVKRKFDDNLAVFRLAQE